MIKNMDREYMYGNKVGNMLGNGKITWCMVKGNTHGQMEERI